MSRGSLAGIVTPEAVVLELPAAGLVTRFLAAFVDLCVSWFMVTVGILLVTLTAGDSDAVTGLLIAALMLVLIVLPALIEWRWNGRSLGKAMFHLRVVTLDGGPVALRHCLIRGLARLVDIGLLAGPLCGLLTTRNQRLGDLMAGTFVCVERIDAYGSSPIAFYPPPGWESYASVVDVGKLTPEQYRLIRAVLVRVLRMSPSQRDELMQRVAASVTPLLSPAPGDVDPKSLLITVAAAYQIRFGGLIGGDQVRRPGWSRPART